MTGTGTLTLTGQVTIEPAAISATLSGRLDLAGAVVPFSVAEGDAPDDLVISAVITNGSLTKLGAGALVLNATNAYGGDTLLNAGGLLVQGVQTNSAVFVDGGTLGGSGLLGPVTANRGAVGPGASPGILQVNGGVTLHAGSTLLVELDGPSPGTGHDQLSVTGPVTLDNVTLGGTLAFTPLLGEVVTILDNDGTDPISGTFGGLPQGSAFALGGYFFTISYTGGSGNDVVLTRVSDPGRLAEITRLSDGTIEFQGQGEATLTYSVEANSDLTASNWVLIGTAMTSGSGALSFIDTNALLFPSRFYRLRSP